MKPCGGGEGSFVNLVLLMNVDLVGRWGKERDRYIERLTTVFSNRAAVDRREREAILCGIRRPLVIIPQASVSFFLFFFL